MPKHVSFRARLLWFLLIIIAASLALSAVYTQRVMSRQIFTDAKADALSELRLLTRLIENRDGRERLSDFLAGAGLDLDSRIDLIARDGSLIASSAPIRGDEPGASFDQEIKDARKEGAGVAVRSGEGGERIYAATRINLTDGNEAILRLSSPMKGGSVLSGLMGNALIGIILAFGLALPACFLFTRQMSASISSMSRVAEGIGKGDYDRRIRIYPGKEFLPLAESINRMAESIQSQIRTIIFQKRQLKAVLDGMKEGVMVLDEEGLIRTGNRALAAIFPGIEKNAGKRPIEVVMDATLQEQCTKALAAKAGEAGEPHSFQIEPEDGRVYEVGIVPVTERGTGLGAVVVFHDVSKLTHLERVRRDFVANVSHELRTPLTSIKGYAETLAESDDMDPAARKNFLDVVVKNANHMTRIVGDLLNLSRLEAGRQPLTPTPVDASVALAQALKQCAQLLATREVGVDVKLPAQGVWIMADQDRLVQVFRNLVENAAKYGPMNSTVTILAEPSGAETALGVSDEGPGIPGTERKRIFERFYRTRRIKEKGSGSSGIGLAIVRHIVEKHGGRVWVESPARGASRGATFFFTMPSVEHGVNNDQDNRAA